MTRRWPAPIASDLGPTLTEASPRSAPRQAKEHAGRPVPQVASPTPPTASCCDGPTGRQRSVACERILGRVGWPSRRDHTVAPCGKLLGERVELLGCGSCCVRLWPYWSHSVSRSRLGRWSPRSRRASCSRLTVSFRSGNPCTGDPGSVILHEVWRFRFDVSGWELYVRLRTTGTFDFDRTIRQRLPSLPPMRTRRLPRPSSTPTATEPRPSKAAIPRGHRRIRVRVH